MKYDDIYKFTFRNGCKYLESLTDVVLLVDNRILEIFLFLL